MGKLRADASDIARAAQEDGFTLLGIAPAHLTALARLPFHPDHRDPFDHLLVAQAIVEGETFVSEDRHAPRYAARILPCSDA